MKWMFSVLLVLVLSTVHAQVAFQKVQQEISALFRDFKGSAGIYVKNLRTGESLSVNADTLFPTASMIKVPILVGVMDRIERGDLSDTMTLVYRDSLLYEGEDILGSFKNGEKISLGKVMMLMLTMSDNTASLWLQSLAGRGDRINEILDSLGFRDTRVNSRTTGRESHRRMYGWGQTTPREMAGLMEMIVSKKLYSTRRSDEMLRLLSRNFWDDVSLSQIPAGVFTASKNGAVDASRSEVVFVNAAGNPYIFCICTKQNEDTSWDSDNEAWIMTRKISALLWSHAANSPNAK